MRAYGTFRTEEGHQQAYSLNILIAFVQRKREHFGFYWFQHSFSDIRNPKEAAVIADIYGLKRRYGPHSLHAKTGDQARSALYPAALTGLGKNLRRALGPCRLHVLCRRGALGSRSACAREAPFSGVWRQRLALRAAAATVRMTGRREAKADLRDAWFLRAKGAALGPAGEHLEAWRSLVLTSTLSPEAMQRAATGFGLGTSTLFAEFFALAERAQADVNPVRTASEIAAAVMRLDPAAEFLALWLADAVLARHLRWPQPLPLLVTHLADPALRRAASVRTGQPTEES